MEYDIAVSSECCGICGRKLAIGTEYFSALHEDKEGGLARRDYCQDCWQPAEGMYCFWKTRVPSPEEDIKPRLAQSEVLFSLLENLSDVSAVSKKSFRYIVALALMRRRLLKLQQSDRQGDIEVMVFVEPKSGTIYEVDNPRLSAAEIEQVAQEVGAILRSKLS